MIEVTFSNSTNEASAFGLTQWDKGQKLKIIWSELPDSFQVHFSSRDSDEAIVVEAKSTLGVAVVEIPDELLKSSEDIFVWVYLTDDDNIGESVKRAVLYVRPRAKPHTLVDELEMTQQEILGNILADIKQNIQYIKENGTDAEYLPSYITEEVQRVLSKVQSYQKEDSIVFIASSDAHLKSDDYNSETAIRHMSQAMKLFTERYPMDFGVYLGDMTSGGSLKDIDEAKNEIMRAGAYVQQAYSGLPAFYCYGTEDYLLGSCYRNGGYISSADLGNLVGRRNRNITAYEAARGYFYKDIEELSLRIICLNTSDTGSATLTPSSETAVMSSTQLQWLCESLDLSAKDSPEDWGIILLGHHPLNMLDKFPVAVSILDSYTKGNEITALCSDGSSISYDFSGRNKARVFAQLHGHLHNLKVNFITDSDIPLVAIPNAGFYNNNFYASDAYTQQENLTYSESLTYNKTPNSAEDTAFCVIVIDRGTGKIYSLCYGAGYDRIIDGTIVTEDSSGSSDIENGDGSSDSGNTDSEGNGDSDSGTGTSYTNLVPLSITSSGVTYNSKGYTDGYKLSSQGELVYGPGYTHTGFMSAGYSDVMRASGGTYDGTAGNYLLAYDADFNLLWLATLTGSDDSDTGIYYSDSGVLEFYPSQVQTGNLEDMAYVRISTVGEGAELIVTRNEEISDSDNSGDVSDSVVNYTNILQYAADENGSIYGSGGYSDGIMLDSSGAEASAVDYTVTGYLVLDSQAIIRIKGLDLDGSEGCCLCLYGSDYELISCIGLSGASDKGNGITYSNGIHTFTPADAENTFGAVQYFRLSGKGEGSDLIITYCEEIA